MPEDNEFTAPGNRAIPDEFTPKPRVSAEAAGYMELEGAEKDADCATVEVDGGVSSDLGCCNLFDPQEGTDTFSCGTCEYVMERQEDADVEEEGEP